jgi:hypothetical protein
MFIARTESEVPKSEEGSCRAMGFALRPDGHRPGGRCTGACGVNALEERYRSTLRVLTAAYREVREEEMIAILLERRETGRCRGGRVRCRLRPTALVGRGRRGDAGGPVTARRDRRAGPVLRLGSGGPPGGAGRAADQCGAGRDGPGPGTQAGCSAWSSSAPRSSIDDCVPAAAASRHGRWHCPCSDWSYSCSVSTSSCNWPSPSRPVWVSPGGIAVGTIEALAVLAAVVPWSYWRAGHWAGSQRATHAPLLRRPRHPTPAGRLAPPSERVQGSAVELVVRPPAFATRRSGPHRCRAGRRQP